MTARVVDTHQKALAVNLDPKIYGVVAEIGAGQEVARWFFRVGGAAGTIAKTVSAYDKTVSDGIYGKTGRYVSRRRLEAMLDHESRLLSDRLSRSRGHDTRFFVFADTMAARNYRGTNECHGWVGLRFLTSPGGEPHDILLHVNLRDPTNLLQQEAVGILGVNLIHAAFFRCGDLDTLLRGLHDGLSVERLEIDLADLSGPVFRDVDAVSIGVKLVRQELARAVLFDAEARLHPPTEILRKRAVVIGRGRFTRPSEIYTRMLQAATQHLGEEHRHLEQEPIALLETSADDFGEAPRLAEGDLAERIRRSLPLAPWVLLSGFRESFWLTGYLRRYTHHPVRFVAGISALIPLLESRFYGGLPGGLIEGIGKLFADNVKLYLYPMDVSAFREHAEGYSVDVSLLSLPRAGVISAGDLPLRPPLQHLYRYLLELGWLVPIAGGSAALLGRSSPPRRRRPMAP